MIKDGLFSVGQIPYYLDAAFQKSRRIDRANSRERAYVRVVQELLTLAGHSVKIDGMFGPATESALASVAGLTQRNYVDQQMWELLTEPFTHALDASPLPSNTSFQETSVSVATAQLKAKAREVGGENSGPWVRLYMDDHEGPTWAWCAGFVTFVIAQAHAMTFQQTSLPVHRTYSCDMLAAEGKRTSRFISSPHVREMKPGDIFVVRHDTSVEDWIHTGFVTEIDKDRNVFKTIEGNTNEDGSREGTSVRARTRSAGPRIDIIRTGIV
jgi:hypothetical protein